MTSATLARIEDKADEARALRERIALLRLALDTAEAELAKSASSN